MLRWADGTLKGIKTFKWEDGSVWSPMHRAEWVNARLAAKNFFEGQAVRGEGGIHAIWPQGAIDNLKALDEFSGYAPRGSSSFTALVSGWGRCVMGDVGWRAEHCRIRSVIIPPRYAHKKFRSWCFKNEVKRSVL
jgi:hypothetical protein